MATLKGIWQFNAVITKPTFVTVPYDGSVVPLQEINYTYQYSNGQRTSQGFAWQISSGVNTENRLVYSLDTATVMYQSTSKGTNKWSSDIVRTVNFGTEEQTVSEEFYSWFTANAVQPTDYITFINNSSNSICISMNEYADLTSYSTAFYNRVIAPDETITYYKVPEERVLVFRTYKGTWSGNTILVPSINGNPVNGEESADTAYAEPSTVSSGTIISYENNSEEVGSTLRWGIVITPAEPEEPEATATVITYNGSTIATLEAGQTATIKTAETEVDHDIVITPVFPIEIAYGDIIATANEGQTATIKCANTEADFDIIVSAKAEEDELSGTTWLFNNTVNSPSQDIYVYSDASSSTTPLLHTYKGDAYPRRNTDAVDGYWCLRVVGNGTVFVQVKYDNNIDQLSISNLANTEIIFYSGVKVTDGFIDWLKANATKQ